MVRNVQRSRTIIKHSKGLADLAILLARPNQEVHITELEGVAVSLMSGHGGHTLDDTAISAYRARLRDLTEEIDEAELFHDDARAERSRAEYDSLVEELSTALGIGGRPRPTGPEPMERLRKAVSARMRDAIRRLDTVHPLLGRHLASAVHTGVYCRYAPETPTRWICEA